VDRKSASHLGLHGRTCGGPSARASQALNADFTQKLSPASVN
jgi:hypothetical protein